MRIEFVIAILVAVSPAIAATDDYTRVPFASFGDSARLTLPGSSEVLRDYPPDALRRGEQGTVGIRYLVTENGMVGEAHVTASSGFRSLDEAAILEVKRWVFRPAVENGKPVSAWLDTHVDYHLGSGRSAPREVPTPCHDAPNLIEQSTASASPDDGKVRRQVLIDRDGTIKEMLFLTPGGWRRYDAQILSNIHGMVRYEPAKRDGKPIPCWFDDDAGPPRPPAGSQ